MTDTLFNLDLFDVITVLDGLLRFGVLIVHRELENGRPTAYLFPRKASAGPESKELISLLAEALSLGPDLTQFEQQPSAKIRVMEMLIHLADSSQVIARTIEYRPPNTSLQY